MTRQFQTASATPIRPEMIISHTTTTIARQNSDPSFQPGAGKTNTSRSGGKIGRPRKRSGMAPEEAIAEAFTDLRMHELATVSAMQAAVRVLLAKFEPEAVERKIATNALHIHPAQKKAKAWEAFVQQHKSITQALSDDFDSVFGKAFARAYEEAIDKLTAGGPPS